MKHVLLVQPSSAAAERALYPYSQRHLAISRTALWQTISRPAYCCSTISADVDLCILFLSMFIQAIIGPERIQNCQDKLIYFVA